MKLLARLLSNIRPYRFAFAIGFFSMIMGLIGQMAVPYIIRAVIDQAIAEIDIGFLALAAGAVIAIAVVRGVFTFGERYSMEYVAQKVVYDIRDRLYEHLQSLSFSFYDSAATGQLMSRVTDDVRTLRQFLGFGILRLSAAVLTFLGVLVVLFSLHWRLALVSLATIPPTMVVVFMFSRRVRPRYVSIRRQLAAVTSRLQENLSGMRVVKSFAREEDEEARFDEENYSYLEKNLAAVKLWAFFFPLMNFITGAGTALLLWYGGREVILGRLSLGTLVAFNSLLLMLIMPLRMLGWIVNMAQRAQAASQRIFEILDTRPEVADAPGAVPIGEVRGEVVFDDISFSYSGPVISWLADDAFTHGPGRAEGGPGDEALAKSLEDSRGPDHSVVVRKINLRVSPGETVALLGATGSGKSTLVNLIPRFYDPDEGRILIDGRDIREVTLDSLRRQIGVVLQDTFLFSTTIRENIAYGRSDATQEEIEEAARAAEIHEFISGLPDGYETLVGERGVGLSGGQKQRVAIARALLMDPRILILDDSTSSVDTETEHAIQVALARLMKGRTTFVIAQRLTTLKNADRVVILEGGRIVDEGTNEALLRRSPIYREIYELQFRPQEEEQRRRRAAEAPAAGRPATSEGGDR